MKPAKFQDAHTTAEGKERAWIKLNNLDTLWFNTGTLCNLSCPNCYIESSPHNDRLSYITIPDVRCYLDEITQYQLNTQEIGFTGGEPFLNPHLLDIVELCLERNFKVLILTNAYRVINRPRQQRLMQLNQKFPQQLTLRVSLDHYSKQLHEKERGENTFEATLKCIQQLHQQGICITIAGRFLANEKLSIIKQHYQKLLSKWQIELDLTDEKSLVIFPEMDLAQSPPEITTDCWSILGQSPDQIMCSSSRMVVKRKKHRQPRVVACTLLAYEPQFELGKTLKDSQQTVRLNHPYCAQFCVLGGASCA